MATKALSKNDLIKDVVYLFARGYTLRAVRRQMVAAHGPKVLDKLTNEELLQIATDSSEQIEAVRAEIAKRALTQGLATKEERLLRLTEMAEAWEPFAVPSIPDQPLRGENGAVPPAPAPSAKAAGVYLRALKEIREEVEPLGMVLNLPPNDPWANLLQEVRDSAQSKPSKVLPQTTDQE